MKYYLVWNEDKTEGFLTVDKQLAYEARKGASSNCYSEEGIFSPVAHSVAEEWDNCTMVEVVL